MNTTCSTEKSSGGGWGNGWIQMDLKWRGTMEPKVLYHAAQ